MDIQQFTNMLSEKGITLSPVQLDQFETYYRLLVEWNEKMNLTAITEREDVYLKHFFDSITAAFYFDFSHPLSICDVGAGAGFPSIPIKICFPNIKVSIVDSLNKRISFLNHLAQELKLEDVSFYHDRAETFGQRTEMRGSFDVVMARAVARLSVLSELCIPLVKVGGTFIAMKAASVDAEMTEAKKAVATFGGEVEDINHFLLPFEESERNIVRIRKQRDTPKKYPRKPGTPNRSPIV